jgi:hypothetical protein
MKFLVTSNERIVLLGINGVGKMSFIRKCNSIFQHKCVNSVDFIKLNERVKFIVFNSLSSMNYEYYRLTLNRPPTRILLMASVISSKSMKVLYQFYIPLILKETILKGLPIDIILTHTDYPRYTWKELELRILKRTLQKNKINSIFQISNNLEDKFNDKYFDRFKSDY